MTYFNPIKLSELIQKFMDYNIIFYYQIIIYTNITKKPRQYIRQLGFGLAYLKYY